MNELRVVIVEPVYQINLGYIARVSKNFGVKRLNLVNPRCNYRGKEAIKYSKHARDLLSNAKLFRSIGQATKGTFVVGTTGLWRKTSEAFHNVYTPRKLLEMVKRSRAPRISLLIGRDNTGLTKEELAMCDANVFIETNEAYPVLNVSHALAVLLYAFSALRTDGSIKGIGASTEEVKRINKLFSIMVSKRKDIRDKKAVMMAFGHMIARSNPTSKEIGALSIALSPRKRA